MSDPLKEQLRGVTPPSPAADEDPVEDEHIEPEDGPVDDKPLADDDRPADNVRGEFLRKLEESERRTANRIADVMDRVESMLQDVAGRNQEPNSAPSLGPGGNPLDRFTVEQLEAGLVDPQIDEQIKAAIQVYLPRRIAREEARLVTQQESKLSQAQHQRDKATDDAVHRYPDLMKDGSKMQEETNRILRSRGKAWVENNPLAVLDAANEAAANLGVTATSGRRPRIPGRPHGNREESPVKRTEKTVLSDEEYEKIARRLRPNLGRNKDGSQKDFDKKFILERAKLYNERYPDQ